MPYKDLSVWLCILTKAVFFAAFEQPLEDSIVRKGLNPLTMHLIVEPLTLIFRAVNVLEFAKAICLAFPPFSVINSSILMYKAATPTSLVMEPIAFKERAIRKDHFTLTMPKALFTPFAFVASTGFKLDFILFVY